MKEHEESQDQARSCPECEGTNIGDGVGPYCRDCEEESV